MRTVFDSPFQRIAACSLRGQPLLLRLRDPRERWLRIHQDGSLEVATGDHRREESCRDIGSLSAPLFERALLVHRVLIEDFRSSSLDQRSPWDHFYPVQAFSSVDATVIEGDIGVECEMGAMTDVFGFRDGRRAFPCVRAIQELLELIRR